MEFLGQAYLCASQLVVYLLEAAVFAFALLVPFVLPVLISKVGLRDAWRELREGWASSRIGVVKFFALVIPYSLFWGSLLWSSLTGLGPWQGDLVLWACR